MMRFYQFSSEEEAIKSIVKTGLVGHEERLMTLFIQQGPEALRAMLRVRNDFVWTVVFDHLVFNLDVLKRCVDLFYPFFKDYVLKNGPLALREVFGIQDGRYDSVFEKLLDDMVIARGLLFEHVHAHIGEYLTLLEKGQGSGIRSQLGLQSSKYDPLWNEVLDFMLDAFSRKRVQLQQKEQTKSLLEMLRKIT